MQNVGPCACCEETDDIMYRPSWSTTGIDICLTCLRRFNADIIHRKDELQAVRERYVRTYDFPQDFKDAFDSLRNPDGDAA